MSRPTSERSDSAAGEPAALGLPGGLLAGLLVLAGLSTACVFGFRGQVPFASEASLSGLDTVVLELPATELVVVGEASRTFIDWSGAWTSLGGSSADALASARKAELVWDSWGAVGRLAAVLPIETRDLTSLDSLDIETASYVAHEINGAGDVFVSNIDAYVAIDLAGGNVELIGGNETVVVTTERGSIDLTTSAAVTASSGFGEVALVLEAGRDVEIDTVGAVTVELGDASSVVLDIDDAGEIRVELDGAAHLGSGSYQRTIGTGSSHIRIRAGGGPVEIRSLAPSP